MQFPHLLSSYQVGSVHLKNRVIMGSMHTNLEEQPQGFERLATFYQARAKGGVGLIITGGVSPNQQGILAPNRVVFNHHSQIAQHKKITDAVNQYNSKICMQILHAGRYGYHPDILAPSPLQAPMIPFAPTEMTDEQVQQQIGDFVNCAKLAEQAGYHGVEIMGSEGYLINQFLCAKTNQRSDKWGGSLNNRMRFALEIVKQIRANCKDSFLLIFRISLIDLVEQGSPFTEVIEFAKQLQACGVDILNSGIGWHESRVPTIAGVVPPAAFISPTATLKQHIDIPIVACNRINTPQIAEEILKHQQADFVSLARPFLADSDFVNKAANGNSHLIAPCIACNQACLDRIFENKVASCLVNPLAGHETLYHKKTQAKLKIAVVGAGPAGIMAAITAAQLGHTVSLFEKTTKLGGQLNLAANIPGKEDFKLLLNYFTNMLEHLPIDVKLNMSVDAQQLNQYEHVIIATGSTPTIPEIDGIEHEKVVTYQQILSKQVTVKNEIVIIGTGGVAIDTCLFTLKHQQHCDYNEHWGIDLSNQQGGLTEKQITPSKRQVTLTQRKVRKPGTGLGKTTIWIHRQELKDYGVKVVSGAQYQSVTQQGLQISTRKQDRLLPAEQIILCAGQQAHIPEVLAQLTVPYQVIGAADKDTTMDAYKAIKQAVELVYAL
ncbi:FAD-dependent oxidoreductase [Catenovulum agarivorans]|nr:NADPH-dependent 2,4-dienoyl-CoA reductase [Catenovulum agarivorans]